MQTVTSQTSQIFAGEVNQQLLAQAVRVYQSNLRQATARTKTRGEINRSKKKWFKQKWTGNARHGARTPALFVGGGVVHGPTGIQDYHLHLSTKMKRQALRAALVAQKAVTLVDDGVTKVDGKTKSAVAALGENLSVDKRLLLVVAEKTPEMERAYHNLAMVYLTTAARVNVLQVANADTIVMTTDGLQALEKRLLTNKEK